MFLSCSWTYQVGFPWHVGWRHRLTNCVLRWWRSRNFFSCSAQKQQKTGNDIIITAHISNCITQTFITQSKLTVEMVSLTSTWSLDGSRAHQRAFVRILFHTAENQTQNTQFTSCTMFPRCLQYSCKNYEIETRVMLGNSISNLCACLFLWRCARERGLE